ncbi:Inositol-pentakisphosphate 2-kinase [Saxophila tyrrhenica]|uniref:Inositol-pentakisphosphate 2-kinase n=1 Tax=Saxophila tyrrhenica TaxID=1690608 RepID=A0AAV9PA91_9PEZI|nr:Inositol-pentakisphosphate 2-kinase [Saxophila tyrrhenica]
MSIPAYYSFGESPRLHAGHPSTASQPGQKLWLKYLNEGGANIVFRILPISEDDELPPHLQGRLLRLRKDLPHVQSAEDQLAAYHAHFKPLFPRENLTEQIEIELGDGLASSVSDALTQLDRPSHRLQDFLPAEERTGMLVTDMTPGPDEILLQVKPKWLAQSPNAPPDARRCRTCALRAQRASKKIRTATDAQESCPFDLISNDEADRRRAAGRLTDHPLLQKFLINDAQPLLQKLRDNQQKLDFQGVLVISSDTGALDLCKAMTLRDCTLFLKLSGEAIDARLADLDLKLPEKLGRWKKVEQELIDHGWYKNTEDSEHWAKEEICLLSRARS